MISADAEVSNTPSPSLQANTPVPLHRTINPTLPPIGLSPSVQPSTPTSNAPDQPHSPPKKPTTMTTAPGPEPSEPHFVGAKRTAQPLTRKRARKEEVQLVQNDNPIQMPSRLTRSRAKKL